jgi:hypothetical protein
MGVHDDRIETSGSRLTHVHDHGVGDTVAVGEQQPLLHVIGPADTHDQGRKSDKPHDVKREDIAIA